MLNPNTPSANLAPPQFCKCFNKVSMKFFLQRSRKHSTIVNFKYQFKTRKTQHKKFNYTENEEKKKLTKVS